MCIRRLSLALLGLASMLVPPVSLHAQEPTLDLTEWGTCTTGKIAADCIKKVEPRVGEHLVLYFVPVSNVPRLAIWVISETEIGNGGEPHFKSLTVRYYRFLDRRNVMFLGKREFFAADLRPNTPVPLFEEQSAFGQEFRAYVQSLGPEYVDVAIPPLTFKK
jgi:hypothetical protein